MMPICFCCEKAILQEEISAPSKSFLFVKETLCWWNQTESNKNAFLQIATWCAFENFIHYISWYSRGSVITHSITHHSFILLRWKFGSRRLSGTDDHHAKWESMWSALWQIKRVTFYPYTHYFRRWICSTSRWCRRISARDVMLLSVDWDFSEICWLNGVQIV